MVLIPASVRIFLSREHADMRRSFTGLSGMVRDGLHADPLSGHLYCFRNKRGDKLKILYFDRTGLAIWYKRLEVGRFHWPPSDAACVELKAGEIAFLLEGVDWKSLKRHKRFNLQAAMAERTPPLKI
jgi:transposase